MTKGDKELIKALISELEKQGFTLIKQDELNKLKVNQQKK